MILTLDIGNTNIKTALFEGMEMLHYWRVSTNRAMSSDEYGILLLNLFAHAGVSPKQVEGIMISSVVPQINFTIEHMCRTYFGMEPHIIGPGIKTGINIRYETRASWVQTASLTPWPLTSSTVARASPSISVLPRALA